MSSYPQQFRNALVLEVKRRLLEESVPRIKKCVAQLSEQEIWHKPNANTNSIGNLILHLCGNVRQWIIAGIGRQTDTRQRQTEFTETGPIPLDKLLQDLDALMEEVVTVLDEMPNEILLQKQSVQCYEESGLSILIHVVEHFSYHVGQITYLTKLWKDMDLGYYAGDDLDAKRLTKDK